jgi:hypothetical protein
MASRSTGGGIMRQLFEQPINLTGCSDLISAGDPAFYFPCLQGEAFKYFDKNSGQYRTSFGGEKVPPKFSSLLKRSNKMTNQLTWQMSTFI